MTDLKTSSEKLNYLFSKINWGASFLDAKSIDAMNTYTNDIKREKEEYANKRIIEILNSLKSKINYDYKKLEFENEKEYYRIFLTMIRIEENKLNKVEK
jgi:hypothetical protein